MPVGDIYVGAVESTYQNNANTLLVCMEMTDIVDELSIPNDMTLWLRDVVVPLILPLINPGVVCRCVTAQQVWTIDPDPGPQTSLKFVELVIIGTGTRTPSAGNFAPGQCSLVIQQVTDQGDPNDRNRGRDFWYGMNCEDLTIGGDTWDLAYMTAVRTLYSTITSHITGSLGNQWDIGIFSRTQAMENINPDFVSNGGTEPDPPTFGGPIFNILTLVRSNPLVRTQRRRQPLDPCLVYINTEVPV